MICNDIDCDTEVVSNQNGAGKGGRPKIYCPAHSSQAARKARSRADTVRLPCGCKASGKYAQCPQHRQKTDVIAWGDPDEMAEGYCAPPIKGTKKPVLDPETMQEISAKILIRHETREAPKGQWMTQTDHCGSKIGVIGQMDLDAYGNPVNPNWADGIDFEVRV